MRLLYIRVQDDYLLTSQPKGTTMPSVLPARSIDKPPVHRFAVVSVVRGSVCAELESSFESQGTAENMFERQYSRWGLTDTNFYLVDWQKQTILKSHEVWTSHYATVLP
jgi:hypothetical protein